jgi:RNA polymerase sigma-70 factor (ECF subfamily)
MDAEFGAILAAGKNGEDWAVSVLFREYHPRLLRYLRAKAPGAAEDLASDVWLAVATQLVRFEGSEGAFRGWIFTIARRQVIGHWRKQRRRRTEPMAPSSFLALAMAADIATGVTAQGAVDALVAGLPPDQAEVVLLRVVADLSVDEVAGIMGKKPGTIRVLQHRALARLAETFSDEDVTRRGAGAIGKGQ